MNEIAGLFMCVIFCVLIFSHILRVHACTDTHRQTHTHTGGRTYEPVVQLSSFKFTSAGATGISVVLDQASH